MNRKISKQASRGWRKVQLKDAVSILGDGLHGTPKYSNNGEHYFINGNNLTNGKIIIKKDTKKVSVEEYNKYKKNLNERTILVSINGTLGNIALYNNEKIILGKSACYFNVLTTVNKLFIKYIVTNKNFQKYIDTFANGTTIKNVSLKTMREYSFLLPPFPEQKAIATMLSSLDDKIENNRKTCNKLEEIAQTIFKQWFVEEAGEDWKKGCLGDIIELIYGKGLKKEIRTGTGYPVIGSNGIVGSHSEFLVEGPGIVIGRKGTLGKVIYLWDNFYPIDTTYYIKSKVESASLLYEYFLLKTLNFEEMNSDSAVPGLNRNIALSTEIKIAPLEKLHKFNNFTSTLIDKLRENTKQIRTLENLRNTLLPKLMSGKVSVK